VLRNLTVIGRLDEGTRRDSSRGGGRESMPEEKLGKKRPKYQKSGLVQDECDCILGIADGKIGQGETVKDIALVKGAKLRGYAIAGVREKGWQHR